MKVFEVMGDGYITSKDAMKLFDEKSDADKIKILKKALADKCDSKEHTEYMILKHTKEIAYSDVWGDDKVGFLYKLLKWKKRKK
jgi:hypothetical protein